jgi:hypothetical protein
LFDVEEGTKFGNLEPGPGADSPCSIQLAVSNRRLHRILDRLVGGNSKFLQEPANPKFQDFGVHRSPVVEQLVNDNRFSRPG